MYGRNFVRHVFGPTFLGSCVALADLLSFVRAARQKRCKDNDNVSADHLRSPRGTGFHVIPATRQPSVSDVANPPSIALTQFSTWDAKLRDLQITGLSRCSSIVTELSICPVLTVHGAVSNPCCGVTYSCLCENPTNCMAQTETQTIGVNLDHESRFTYSFNKFSL